MKSADPFSRLLETVDNLGSRMARPTASLGTVVGTSPLAVEADSGVVITRPAQVSGISPTLGARVLLVWVADGHDVVVVGSL